MKKIISLLVVLAMLMSMAPVAFATETAEYQEVTIPEAIELAELDDGNKYLVRGTITEVANATYGNVYIEDAEGNSLYVYGIYDADGTNRYDAMETKPQAGDEVLLLGILMTYNGNAQMKNAWVQELVVGEHEEEPVYELVTAPEAGVAYKFGMIQGNVSATSVYYLNGKMSGYYMDTTTSVGSAVDVYLEEVEGGYNLYTMIDGAKKYINMVVSGTYVNGAFEDAASTVYTFDAESNTVVATVNGELYWFGTRNDKTFTTVGPVKTSYNGFYMEFYAEVVEEPETPAVEPTMFLGNNELTASQYNASEYHYVAEQTGTLYITLRSYTCNGVEYGEQMLGYGWSELYINGERVDSMQETLEVTKGDTITVEMTCDYDTYCVWLYLSYEAFFVEPVGSKLNPVRITPDECPTTTVEIPAGEEVWYALDYEFAEHILYVYGENAYIAYEGWIGDERGQIRVDAVDGVVTYEVWEYNICIGNAGTEAAVFEIDGEIPLGAYSNPYEITDGEHVINITASQGVKYLEGYAPVTGTLTVTVDTEVDGYWSFTLQNSGDPNDYTDNTYEYISNSGDTGNTVTIDVKQGDYITANIRLNDKEWNSCDGAVTITFTYEGAAVEPPVGETEELTLGNTTADVAEGNVIAYTWTADADGLFAINVLSDNWTYRVDVADAQGTVRSSSDTTVVGMTVVKVVAGDVVTVTIGTADGAAAEVMFNANTYAGTAEDPVYLALRSNAANTAWALNADLPAGEYVYSMDIGSTIFELTVNGELTEYTADPMGWDPATVVINNTEETNAVFEIELNYPAGTMYNPDELELGYQEGQMIMFDSLSHWYVYTATEETLLVIDMLGDNWYYWGAYMNADGSFDFSRMTATHAADDEAYGSLVVPVTVIKLAAGETFALCIGTIDGSDIVEFTANVYAGTAADPAYLGLRSNASYTAWELNVDLPVGEYVYSMDIGSTIFELTVNGEKTEYTVDPMGWDPATVVINNTAETNDVFEIELNYPAGTMYNPDELELGYQEGQMIMFDSLSHWYVYTATEDTLLAIEMMGENWYYWGVYMNADGSFDYSRMTATYAADDYDNYGDPMVPMTVIKLAAGESFALCIGSIDGSEIVEFSAMTYAGTEEDPVMFNYCWTETETGMALNADLPAGEYFYGARINGMTLIVNGVETEYIPGMGRMPCVFTINNAESGVVALEANMPVGSMDNPEIVDEGEYTVEIEPETYAEYWYSFTAPADGTLTVTVSSTTGYLFVVNNETAGVYGDYQWSDEDPINPMTVQVQAGDVVKIMVGAYDPEMGMGAGATITVDLQFTPKPDVVLGDVNGDGAVDTTDAKLVMQYDLGLIDASALTLEAADVNGDGAVDTTDAKLIMQLDLGLIEEF